MWDVECDAQLDVEYFLSRIVYYRVHDYIEQLALINLLKICFPQFVFNYLFTY